MIVSRGGRDVSDGLLGFESIYQLRRIACTWQVPVVAAGGAIARFSKRFVAGTTTRVGGTDPDEVVGRVCRHWPRILDIDLTDFRLIDAD